MKKVLIVATIDQHIRHFHLPFIEKLKSNGFLIDIASNGEEDFNHVTKKYNLPFTRNPVSISNLKALIELKNLISQNEYDIIHCHTPVGGVVTRVAKMLLKESNSKIVYTAHGFHFYAGAPCQNWLIYYNVEKMLSKWTDLIITINKEDFNITSKKFKSTQVAKINGVGVDLQKFDTFNEDKNLLKEELGFNKNDILLIYVAELSDRKNQKVLIHSMKYIIKESPNIKLLLVGMGPNEEYYKNLIIKLNLTSNVILMGYRRDVPKLMGASSLAISSSLQEGLPINIIEAISMGLPIVCSNCRGNRDVVSDGINGLLVDDNNPITYANKILFLLNNVELYKKLKENNLEARIKYDVEFINEKLMGIYDQIIDNSLEENNS